MKPNTLVPDSSQSGTGSTERWKTDYIPKGTGQSEFDRVRLTDHTVHAILDSGRGLEDVVVSLAAEKALLVQRISELTRIAPRKVTLHDGRVMIWRCPDELVPEM